MLVESNFFLFRIIAPYFHNRYAPVTIPIIFDITESLHELCILRHKTIRMQDMVTLFNIFVYKNKVK